MMYFGGKERIAKELAVFINQMYLNGNNKSFYDLFCGSCNILTKVDSNRDRYGNDRHKYLIAMWEEMQKGWIPPTECTKEQYDLVKQKMDVKPYVSGFIGFGCSFSGKWWGGFAKSKENRNYCLNAHNSSIKKIKNLMDVSFSNKDYSEVRVYEGSVVYCDIPYKNTTQYSVKEVDVFDHDRFYDWCIKNKDKYTILVSEYEHNVPNGFEVVWRKNSKQDIRSKDGKQKETVEVLMTPVRGGDLWKD